MPSLPSPATPVAGHRPVDSSERLILLDVLRGFALCGVFVSNVRMHLSGAPFLPAEVDKAWMDSPVNAIVEQLFHYLVAGKAMFLFSFLFGLGFAIQLGRAEQRGASGQAVYARRLGVLLLIGLTHVFALWYGDVLSQYALAGFVLMLFWRVPDRRLLGWGLALIVLSPLVFQSVQRLVPLMASSPEVVQAASRESMARVAAIRSQTFAAISSDSYLAAVRANAHFYLHAWIKPVTLMYGLVSIGRFLLGLLAGRLRLFHDVEPHRPLFRRILGWGLFVAVIGNGASLLIDLLTTRGVIPKGGLWRPIVMPTLWEVAVMGLGAVYLAGLTLLFQRPLWRRLLSVLAPAGQMALTHYLSQSLIAQLVFYGYGLGLIGKIGPAATIALTFGLFWIQVLVSHLWLARFRFGPAEWVWRSLTYGKRQPMRRTRAPATESAASV